MVPQQKIITYFLTFGVGGMILLLALFGVLIYWWRKTLHQSSLQTPPRTFDSSDALHGFMLLGIFYFFMSAGFEFDGWWHTAIGRDTLWIPPHIIVIISMLLFTTTSWVMLKKRLISNQKCIFFLTSSFLFQGAFYFSFLFDDAAHRLFGKENISTPLVTFAPPHLFLSITLFTVAFLIYQSIHTLHIPPEKESQRQWTKILVLGSVIALIFFQYQAFLPLGIYRMFGFWGQLPLMILVGAALSRIFYDTHSHALTGFFLAFVIITLEAIRMSGGGISPDIQFPFVAFRIPSSFFYFSFLIAGLALDGFRIVFRDSRVSEKTLIIAGALFGFTQASLYYLLAKWWVDIKHIEALSWLDVGAVILFGTLGTMIGFLLPYWIKNFFRQFETTSTYQFKKKLVRIALPTILFLGSGFIGVIFIFFSPFTQWQNNEIPMTCTGTRDQLPCYISTARSIARQKDISSALHYMRTVVIPATSYNQTHIIMHTLGRESYLKTHDIAKALFYLPDNALTTDYYLYDGYSHGLFQEFFYQNRDTGSTGKLMQKACPHDILSRSVISNSSLNPQEDLQRTAQNCYHAVGHALMYSSGNRIPEALTKCGETKTKQENYWCLYGVFMENSYLYSSLYDDHAQRPFVSGNSMAKLCLEIKNAYQQSVCTKFVGRSFLAKNKGDFKGAFQECHTLQNEYQPQCIAQVARLFIPPLLAFNPQQMIAACDAAGEDYKGMCLSAVAQRVDVEHKSYHAPLQKNDFCKLVEKRFQQECVSPIMNYSLYF